MKVLVATSKPFAPVAIEGIKKVTDAAGYELALLEKYTDKAELLSAVSDADALIVRSDKVDAEVFWRYQASPSWPCMAAADTDGPAGCV